MRMEIFDEMEAMIMKKNLETEKMKENLEKEQEIIGNLLKGQDIIENILSLRKGNDPTLENKISINNNPTLENQDVTLENEDLKQLINLWDIWKDDKKNLEKPHWQPFKVENNLKFQEVLICKCVNLVSLK